MTVPDRRSRILNGFHHSAQRLLRSDRGYPGRPQFCPTTLKVVASRGIVYPVEMLYPIGVPLFPIYRVSEDAYPRYVELLAEQGIKAEPERKETSEMVKSGEVTLSVYGALYFQGEMIPYTLTERGRHRTFAVEPEDLGKVQAKELRAALKRAFPQLETEKPRHSKPSPRGPMDILLSIGCILVLVIIALVCLFAIVGLYSVFK